MLPFAKLLIFKCTSNEYNRTRELRLSSIEIFFIICVVTNMQVYLVWISIWVVGSTKYANCNLRISDFGVGATMSMKNCPSPPPHSNYIKFLPMPLPKQIDISANLVVSIIATDRSR